NRPAMRLRQSGTWGQKGRELKPGVMVVVSGRRFSRTGQALVNFQRETITMPKGPKKPIPINELRQEDGAHELATSPDMEPYLKFAAAVMQDPDPVPALGAIRQLPLENRYVWRVASLLKCAFADCDDLNVEADRRTMTAGDLAKVLELLKYRP